MARIDRKTWLQIYTPTLVITVIALVVAWMFVKPAPPGSAVIATGSRNGAYFSTAQAYADYLGNNGMTLNIRETAGSIENYELLLDPASGVVAAIVQGGTLPQGAEDKLEAVVSIYYEPVWVFVRNDANVNDLRDLRGKRIAVGPQGSGTRMLARELLAANGVKNPERPDKGLEVFTESDLTGEKAATALANGEIDAAFIVSSPDAPIIAYFMSASNVALLGINRSMGYERAFNYLAAVTLHEGSLDFANNLPARDTPLIAPAATIVVRQDTHVAVVQLLVQAAVREHERGTLLSPPGTFPSTARTDLPVPEETKYYLKRGPSFLQRHMPFWLASLVDRLLIMMLPLLTLIIPLARMAPPTYRWRIRSRIYRWYSELREADEHLRTGADREAIVRDAKRMDELEEEITGVVVPLSYMQEFYNLRLHIAFIKRKLTERLGEEPPKPKRTGSGKAYT